jgi:hypothetical protein
VTRIALALLLAACALDAPAYCIYNQLADRSVRVEQEPHPDKKRDERVLKVTIPPGGSTCCQFHNLDCNPQGRNNSVVFLAITIPGQPAYACSFPASSEPNVKVTGSGTVRVQRNARAKSAYPYVLRIRTHDRQDLTGPSGLACPETRPKGKK